MANKVFRVYAEWDPEAGVYHVSESDVPGLAAEATTTEGLLEKLRVLVPELLRLNRNLVDFDPDGEFPISLMATRLENIRANR